MRRRFRATPITDHRPPRARSGRRGPAASRFSLLPLLLLCAAGTVLFCLERPPDDGRETVESSPPAPALPGAPQAPAAGTDAPRPEPESPAPPGPKAASDPRSPSAANASPRVLSASARGAVRWLDGQLGRPLRDEGGHPARLIDSYEGGPRVGWSYDAALAVIAYLAVGQPEVSREILRGLAMIQAEAGGWPFSFDPDTAHVASDAKYYVGSIAWVVMAINAYERSTSDRRFAPMARRGLSFILRFRVETPNAAHHGAVSMGPPNPRAFSIENNIGCLTALVGRGHLDGDAGLLELAAGIRHFVTETLWDETTLGPGNGFFQVGYRDNSLYLDAQSWTVLALAGQRPVDPRLLIALDTATRHLETRGHLGEISDIRGFNETNGGVVSQKVWAEGSEGMVAALRRVGSHRRAADYHEQTRRYQTGSGGIPYSTENADAWPTEPAVASTAWFLFNELTPPLDPFVLPVH